MRRTVIALVAVLALGLVACSGKYKPDTTSDPGVTEETGPTGATGLPADCEDQTGGDATITISDYAFQPSCLIVDASASLTIVNEDQSAHSFSVEGGAVDVTLDVGDTAKVKSLAALAPGSYGFNCHFHPGMDGTIVVE